MVQWKATDTCEYKIQSGNYSGYSKCRNSLFFTTTCYRQQTLCSKKRRMLQESIIITTMPTLLILISSICCHINSRNIRPALASGDLDGNGFDDIVIGGNSYIPTCILFQQPDGKFIRRNLLTEIKNKSSVTKDEGILIFDANNDGKPDIYISSGGYALSSGDHSYQDRLYINDGKGNFKIDTAALSANHNSKFCVRAFDYNRTGKWICSFQAV